MHIHAIIIGGGISGLYTAYKYVNDGHNVILIEKSNRLGGRIHTIYDSQYHYEAGAGRINSSHELLLNLCNTFNLTLSPITHGKTYRSVASGSSVLPVRATNAKLKQVCIAAETMPIEELQNMSFGELCEKVLGVTQTIRLVNEFGYNGEFSSYNAFDAVKVMQQDFVGAQKYYVCNEGLSELVSRIEGLLLASGKVKIYKECEALSVKYNKHYKYMKVVTRLMLEDTRVFKSDVVVCSLPKTELQALMNESVDPKMNTYVDELINTVETVPLHRVYGKFSQNWFHKIPVTTTNDSLRQFIPVNGQHAIAMVSYSDTQYADYWNQYAQQGDKQLRSALLKHLHVVFPEVKMPRMQWVQNYYWQTGVHMWKPGVDSNEAMKKIGRLMGEDVPFFVVGEAYSAHQSWIEGGLQTVEQQYPVMMQLLKHYVHESVKLPSVRRTELARYMQSRGIAYWVMLRTNGKLRVLNTEPWIKQGTMTQELFMANNYGDMTNLMPVAFYKDFSRKEFRSDVMTMIHNITIAFVDDLSKTSLR